MPHLFLDHIREGYKIVVLNTDLVVDKISDNADITIVNGTLTVTMGPSGIGENVKFSFLERSLQLSDGSKPIAWAGYSGSYLSSYSPFQPIVEKELPEHFQFIYGRNWDSAVQAECEAWRDSHPAPRTKSRDFSSMFEAARKASQEQPGQSVVVTSTSKKYDQPELLDNNFPNEHLAPSDEYSKLFFGANSELHEDQKLSVSVGKKAEHTQHSTPASRRPARNTFVQSPPDTHRLPSIRTETVGHSVQVRMTDNGHVTAQQQSGYHRKEVIHPDGRVEVTEQNQQAASADTSSSFLRGLISRPFSFFSSAEQPSTSRRDRPTAGHQPPANPNMTIVAEGAHVGNLTINTIDTEVNIKGNPTPEELAWIQDMAQSLSKSFK